MDLSLAYPICASTLFRAVCAEDLSRLTSYTTVQRFQAGERLLEPDRPADRFFVLTGGHVELAAAAGPTMDAVIRVLTRGDTVGLEAVLDGGPFHATARAHHEAEAVVVPAAPFRQHLTERPAMVLATLEGASRMMRTLQQDYADLLGKAPIERLVDFLLSLAPQTSGSASIRLPYEKRVIASCLGISPETLSRLFGRLRPFGVSASRTEFVRIGDVATLRDRISTAICRLPANRSRRSA